MEQNKKWENPQKNMIIYVGIVENAVKLLENMWKIGKILVVS